MECDLPDYNPVGYGKMTATFMRAPTLADVPIPYRRNRTLPSSFIRVDMLQLDFSFVLLLVAEIQCVTRPINRYILCAEISEGADYRFTRYLLFESEIMSEDMPKRDFTHGEILLDKRYDKALYSSVNLLIMSRVGCIGEKRMCGTRYEFTLCAASAVS